MISFSQSNDFAVGRALSLRILWTNKFKSRLTQIKGKNRDHSGHFAAQSGCPLERKGEELIGSCLK